MADAVCRFNLPLQFQWSAELGPRKVIEEDGNEDGVSREYDISYGLKRRPIGQDPVDKCARTDLGIERFDAQQNGNNQHNNPIVEVQREGEALREYDISYKLKRRPVGCQDHAYKRIKTGLNNRLFNAQENDGGQINHQEVGNNQAAFPGINDAEYGNRLLDACKFGNREAALFFIDRVQYVTSLFCKDIDGKNSFHYAKENQAMEVVAGKIHEKVIVEFLVACKEQNQVRAEAIFVEIEEFDISIDNCLHHACRFFSEDLDAIQTTVSKIVDKGMEELINVGCEIQ